jgi:cytochrome c peroxidase
VTADVTKILDKGRYDALTHKEWSRYLLKKGEEPDPKSIGAFKTPTLRSVELTSPYMHDGQSPDPNDSPTDSAEQLHKVVAFFIDGGRDNKYLDERMRAVRRVTKEWSSEKRRDATVKIVAFLRSLTGDEEGLNQSLNIEKCPLGEGS